MTFWGLVFYCWCCCCFVQRREIEANDLQKKSFCSISPQHLCFTQVCSKYLYEPIIVIFAFPVQSFWLQISTFMKLGAVLKVFLLGWLIFFFCTTCGNQYWRKLECAHYFDKGGCVAKSTTRVGTGLLAILLIHAMHILFC